MQALLSDHNLSFYPQVVDEHSLRSKSKRDATAGGGGGGGQSSEFRRMSSSAVGRVNNTSGMDNVNLNDDSNLSSPGQDNSGGPAVTRGKHFRKQMTTTAKMRSALITCALTSRQWRGDRDAAAGERALPLAHSGKVQTGARTRRTHGSRAHCKSVDRNRHFTP